MKSKKTFVVTFNLLDHDQVTVEADDYKLDEETYGEWIEFVNFVDDENEQVIAMFRSAFVLSVVTAL